MNEEELATSIKEKMPDFPIHVSDLKAPTGKFVQSYFVRILEELGMEVDALKERHSEQLRNVDYPDAYRHILSLANLHGAVCYVFEHIDVDHFSVLDLIEPTPRRTLYLITAMNTFHTYADWKAQNMQDTIAELHQRKTDYNQLRAQCEELKAQLNKRASEQAQREMQKKEVIALKDKTKQKLLQLKKEANEIQEDVSLSEVALEKEKQKQGVLQAECQKAEAVASELRNQIVKSPNQLEAELNRLHNEKRKCEEEKQRLAQVMQEKGRQKNLYENFLSMQEECEVKLKDIISLHTCLKVGERKLDEIQKKKQASMTEEQEIKGKTQKLRAKITQLQEQKMAFSIQWEKREASLTQSIEEINREQNQLKKKLDDANSKVDEIRAERMAMEEKLNSLRLLSEKQNMMFEELYTVKTAKQDACVKKILDIQKSIVENLKKDK